MITWIKAYVTLLTVIVSNEMRDEVSLGSYPEENKCDCNLRISDFEINQLTWGLHNRCKIYIFVEWTLIDSSIVSELWGQCLINYLSASACVTFEFRNLTLMPLHFRLKNQQLTFTEILIYNFYLCILLLNCIAVLYSIY